MSIPESMKGVVLVEPFKVQVREEPTPRIQEDKDAIIKVHLAGLCGKSSIFKV